MNPESLSTPEPATDAEVRAVAWALGQLDPAEAAAFEREMAASPALAAYAAEMRSFSSLVAAEYPAASDGETEARLPDESRARVTAALREETPKPARSSKRVIWIPLALTTAAAAGLMLTINPRWSGEGGMLTTPLARQNTVLSEPVLKENAEGMKEEKWEQLVVPSASGGSIRPVSDMYASAPVAPSEGSDHLAAAAAADYAFIRSDDDAKPLQSGAAPASVFPAPAKAKADVAWTTATPPPPPSSPSAIQSLAETKSQLAAAAAPPEGRARLATAVESRSLGRTELADSLQDREAPDRYYRFANNESLAERQSAESYKSLPQNPFYEVSAAPLSTFSIDVDTASYANVRRFLNQGQRPPAEAVRLEELVNYFPYAAEPPSDGKPFAVNVDTTAAPWNPAHRLARVTLKGREVAAAQRPAGNFVFLVDVSGSMNEPNKLPLVQQSLRLLTEQLTENDRVSLVTYAGNSGVALPSTGGQDKAKILSAIDALQSGGGTNGAGGIMAAYDQAAAHFIKEGVNRVVLATDGDFNVGLTSHEELLRLIQEKAKTGVFLSVLGYGGGNLKDDTMELLADKGNGNYAYIDSLSEARKALVDQMSGTMVTIAKDVKIQIEFNPAAVRAYKLLGYENRLLAKEDFNDDKKDAGEIGAGHTVTALYELVPAGSPDAPALPVVDGLKYQQTPAVITPKPDVTAAALTGEMMTVKLRWKQPQGDTSELMEVPVKDNGAGIAEAAPETRWAAAVAGFAQLLRGNAPPALTWDSVRELARGAKGADPFGHRGEFLQMIDKAESLTR